MILKKLNQVWNRLTRNDMNYNFETIEKNFNNVVDVVSKRAYNQVVDAAKLIWLEPVLTFADLVPTYPDAVEGNAAMAREVVNGVNKVYRYNGSEWIEIQQISADAVNEVDERLSQQLSNKAIKISPRQFGAVCDGLTDDSDAINQAVAYCKINNYTLESAETHFISNTITVNCNAELKNATFLTDGTLDKVIIVSDEIMIEDKNIELPTLINTSFVSDYTQNNIGVYFNGLKFNNLSMGLVKGFKVGAKVYSDWANGEQDDFTWNSIKFTSFINNETHLILETAGDGYINQNTFEKFMSSKHGNTNKDVDKQIIAINNSSLTGIGIDNNTFINCALENGTDHGRENIVAEFKNCTNTTFVGCRYEVYNNNKIILDGGRDNVFVGGYNLDSAIFNFRNNPLFKIISGQSIITQGTLELTPHPTMGCAVKLKGNGSQVVVEGSTYPMDLKNGANLVKRTSVPVGNFAGEYTFFDDVLGHRRLIQKNGDNVAETIYADMLRFNDRDIVHTSYGNAQNRPVGKQAGFPHFDSDLGIPIWWTGTTWVDTIGRFTNAPSSKTGKGRKGDISADANYIYVCHDTNNWVRSPIDTSW